MRSTEKPGFVNFLNASQLQAQMPFYRLRSPDPAGDVRCEAQGPAPEASQARPRQRRGWRARAQGPRGFFLLGCGSAASRQRPKKEWLWRCLAPAELWALTPASMSTRLGSQIKSD